MSESPLHHKNVEKEIYEISTMALTDDGFKIGLNFGPYAESKLAKNGNSIESVEVFFSAVARLDFYSDEGYNQSFKDAELFDVYDKNIPGLIVSETSAYLDEYKAKEGWAAIVHNPGFRHFVIWSYGSGVIHILTDVDPFVGEITNAH